MVQCRDDIEGFRVGEWFNVEMTLKGFELTAARKMPSHY